VTRAFVFLALLGGMATTCEAACQENVRKPWASSLQLEARAFGQNCAASVVVLSVLNAKGEPIWATLRLSPQVAVFSHNATSPKQMRKALEEWISVGLSANDQTTAQLPDWKVGADAPERPEGTEFGFFADQDMSQAFWMEVKQGNYPLFCFVQGMESESCIANAGAGGIVEIGGRTFPG
jgi:hypothetical protein